MTDQPSIEDRRPTFTGALFATVVALIAAEPARAAQSCGIPTAPDLAVGDITAGVTYGALGAESAYSFGVALCNFGTVPANWSPSTPQHPVVATNLYRLHDGRFEQLGQGWVKHESAALQQGLCCPCSPHPNLGALGAGCSTTSSASIMGGQVQLGPRSEVNALTGQFPVPFGAQGVSGDLLYKRLRAMTADVDPASFGTALYFVEAQVVAADDALAGHGANNASWRALTRSGAQSGGAFRLDITGSTVVGEPALAAWRQAVPSVDLRSVAVPADGRLWVASDCIALPTGGYRYEYAVTNLDSHRAVRSFRIPIDANALVTGAGMSFPLSHSGEPYSNAAWTVTVLPGSIEFSTSTFASDPNANALRWGTTYSFWFRAASAPGTRTATLGLFRSGVAADPFVGVCAPTGPTPIVTTYCNAVQNSTGATGVLEARDFDLVGRAMRLAAEQLPVQAAAYSLVSETPGLVVAPGGSMGNLCLGGAIGRRVGGTVLSTGATGTLLEDVDLDRIPTPTGLVAVLPGDTWHFQVWHRDSVAGSATSNFTGAVRLQFP
jgi:hypothetical protein